MESKHVQNIVVAALMAFVLRDVAVKYMETGKATAAIDATNSVILSAGRDLNVAPDEIERVFRECVLHRPKAGKGALLALQPATMKSNTVVRIGGPAGEEIPGEVIANMPPPSVVKTKDEPAQFNIDGIDIEVMASDIDRRKNGWAVKLPAGSPFPGKRISAVLDPAVEPSSLMYRRDVTADITVFQDDKGKPRRVLIRAVH